MKTILLVFSFVFSTSAFAAYVSPNSYISIVDGSGDAYPAVNVNACDAVSCYANQAAPYSSYLYGYDVKPADTDRYFYLETDLVEYGYPVYQEVYREFFAGGSYEILQDGLFTISWQSLGLYDASFLFNGSVFDLQQFPSGSFETSLTAGHFFWAYMSGKANSINAFISFDILPPPPPSISEVPLPASIFFLAPSLIGFLGLRRKLIT